MEESASVVACVAWVRRGASKEVPDRVGLSEDSLRTLLQSAERDLRVAERKTGAAAARKAQRNTDGLDSDDDDWETDEDDEEEEEEEGDSAPWSEADAAKVAAEASAGMDMERDTVVAAAAGASQTDAELEARYNLADYDDDDDDGMNDLGVGGGGKGGAGAADGSMANGLAGLVYHASNADDPYLAVQEDEEDEEEIDDFRVRPEDNLLVVGQTEDVYSHLAVNVFDEVDTHLFVHHDVMLSSYPLALEWLDYDPESEGAPSNLLAVGSMSPQIEVWDLDIVDGVEPAFTLGMPVKGGKKKSKDHVGHTKEVMALSWNCNQRNLLASGSADGTVKLWDLSSLACLRTYTHHKDKVSCVEWNPVESAVLLTGSFDRTAKVFDTRNPDAVATWRFATDVECLKWNPFEPHLFLASTEDGFVYAGDTRNPGKTLYTIQAHDLAVSSIAFSHFVPGLMVTASIDKSIKVWDVHGGKPKFVVSHELDRSALYTAAFSPDSPGVVAIGGMEKGVTTLDVFDSAAVMRAFSSRPIKEQPRPVQKRAPPPDDANDETLVYAEAEDPDDDKESWLDIVKDLQISPSEQTVQGAEANATNAASDSDGGTKKKSAGNKKGAKKKGGKKKKR
eukprot:m.84949 g.84949  ORF g.84949 m.84949 type:complete len:621 (+) comp9613_c0_seq1:98-1960(+)